MKKNLLLIFLMFLLNSIFSYTIPIKPNTEKELQEIFNKNKEIIVVYRSNITDDIYKKYIEDKIPKQEYNFSNENRIAITIKYMKKNEMDIFAEIYTPNNELTVKAEIKLRKEILFDEIEKLVEEIDENEGRNLSDILNDEFSDKFLENVKSFISYSYYNDGSVNSKTEYNFDTKSINVLTYLNNEIFTKTIAKYRGSIQNKDMDIDFYYDLSKAPLKMKAREVENGQEIRTFYPNGKLESVGVYKDNILNGSFKEYNEDGSLKKETF